MIVIVIVIVIVNGTEWNGMEWNGMEWKSDVEIGKSRFVITENKNQQQSQQKKLLKMEELTDASFLFGLNHRCSKPRVVVLNLHQIKEERINCFLFSRNCWLK